VRKIKEIATDPYAKHNNVTKLQGPEGYRLRIGDWRVIYELHDDVLELWALEVGWPERRDLLMRIETITRKGREFAVIPLEDLQKLMEDAEMLADVRAYDAVKGVWPEARTNSFHLSLQNGAFVGNLFFVSGANTEGLLRSNCQENQKCRVP
jgi:hypothetical protein